MSTKPLSLPSEIENRERLEALYALAVEIAVLRDLPAVLDTALSPCLELTESRFGFIGLNTSEGKLMNVVAIRGFHPSKEFYFEKHGVTTRAQSADKAVRRGLV